MVLKTSLSPKWIVPTAYCSLKGVIFKSQYLGLFQTPCCWFSWILFWKWKWEGVGVIGLHDDILSTFRQVSSTVEIRSDKHSFLYSLCLEPKGDELPLRTIRKVNLQKNRQLPVWVKHKSRLIPFISYIYIQLNWSSLVQPNLINIKQLLKNDIWTQFKLCPCDQWLHKQTREKKQYYFLLCFSQTDNILINS